MSRTRRLESGTSVGAVTSVGAFIDRTLKEVVLQGIVGRYASLGIVVEHPCNEICSDRSMPLGKGYTV